MRRRRVYEVVPWDGLVADARGRLWLPEEVTEICRRRLEAMETHPGLAWLRAEDEAEVRRG